MIDYNNEDLNLSDQQVFTKIWTDPRQVFRYINDNHYDKYVKTLLVLAGISSAFNNASSKNMGDDMSLWSIIGLSIILGGLLGWISFYIYAALLSWTGRWLNGQGETSSILRILSFAMIPSLIAFVFFILQIGIYGVELFKEDGNITSAGLLSNIFLYFFMLLEIIFSIWTIILCIIGISEVQKLSIGKSIVNMLIPLLLFIVPILIFVLLFLDHKIL